MTDRITITAAAPATYDADGNLVALLAYSASQPRVESGPGGGQWTSGGEDTSGAQVDDQTKLDFQRMLSMSPADRAKFLAGMSPDQLKKMGSLLAQSKASDGAIAQIRNAVADTMKSKGLDPGASGLKAKPGAKPKAAGKGKSGGSKGGGSKGKSSGGGGKKSSGGSKSGGSKSSGSSSSGKKSSSGSSGSSSKKTTSSSSKTTGDTATTSKTSTGKKATPPPVPVITPSRRPGAGPPPPGSPSRPQPVRAAGTAASGVGGGVRIVASRTAEAPTTEETA